MNEYQNTYEKEINLMELFVFCLKKWRWVLIAMLLIGLLAGGYKYWSINKSNQAVLSAEGQEKEEETETEEEEEIVVPGPQDYTDRYEVAIEKSLESLEEQEAYMKDSVIMQLDGNHLPTGILTFYVAVGEEAAGANVLDTLVSAYAAYVRDGRLAKELEDVDPDVSLSDLQYLLSFSNNQSGVSGVTMAQLETGWPTQNVLEIRIFAKNETLCAAYLEAIEEAVLAYSQELQATLPAHELRVLAATQSERMSSSIIDSQRQIVANITASFKNVQALQAELKAYKEAKIAEEKAKEEGAADSAEEKKEGETETVKPVWVNPVSGAVKFGIIGLVLGVFLAGFAAILVYITSGKLQSVECFEEEFGMKLLGRVADTGKGKNFIDRLVYRLEEGPYADIPYEEQIKIVAANIKAASKGLQKIMLAGTMSEKVLEDVCAKLKAEITGVEFSTYKQLVFCAAALEEVNEYDGVVFLERKEVSTTKLIHREKELVESRDVKVIGTVAV